MASLQTIPVLAASHFDPGAGRVEFRMPEGSTVAQMVAAALPAASPADLRQCRVSLTGEGGTVVVLAVHWPLVRPKAGVRVVIRLLASGDNLRSILAITVAVGAIAMGQVWGAQLGGVLLSGASAATAAAVGSAVIGIGVTVIGNLLINALIPPVRPERMERRERYSISGWQNRMDPNGAVPDVLGRLRIAPPFAARSHTEIVGDWQYVRTAFVAGYGELQLSDFRIGDTSIADYDEVEIEVRSGLPEDLPLSLYPRQIVEETVGAELTRMRPRDDMGDTIDGPSELTPVIRTTGEDAAGASIILAWPAGLVRISDSGKKKQTSVRIRIEHRPVNGEAWTPVTELKVEARKTDAFYRQHTWNFASRGRWQIRMTMLSEENTDTSIQNRTVWAGLQTLRPEYPLNFGQPIALVAMRIKATHQLNGSLDNINMMAERVCLDWDAASNSWIRRATRNPAALFRHVLQGAANWRPVSDAGLDLAALEDWHDFCRLKGLHYDRELSDAATTLRDVLTEIAAAGRASPRHDGVRWGVVIDRPQELVIDHISPRNSWAFTTTRSYVDPPHALRVSFLDAANDYKPAERLIRWPGYTGDITLTEELQLPGKTDATEVYREGLRRAFETIHRPDVYQVTQDGPARVATRGDLISLSHDILDKVQVSARVRDVQGTMILLDELVEIAAGGDYALRFRRFGKDDPIGVSLVVPVTAPEGLTDAVTAGDPALLPKPGDLVMFGIRTRETFQLRVAGIEAAQDMASLVRLVDAAPIIDQLTDAAVIPPYASRVGEELEPSLIAPATPRFTSVSTGIEGTDDRNLVDYQIEQGDGAIQVSTYRIQHRLAGATVWTNFDIPVANGGGSITGYAAGQQVELLARSLTSSGRISAPTAIISFVVGENDEAIPEALDTDGVLLSPLLGGALVQFATGADLATTQVQIYRSQSDRLDRGKDSVGAPVSVSPQQTYSFAVGDTTRKDIVQGGNMSAAASWTRGAGWTIASGVATHAVGSAGDLSQPIAVAAGKWIRIGYRLTASAGSVMPRLTGGSDRPGQVASASGVRVDRIQAVSGNARLALGATADFAGTVDDVVAYVETTACLGQGTHHLWLEPQNADGVPGAVAGPFTIFIT